MSVPAPTARTLAARAGLSDGGLLLRWMRYLAPFRTLFILAGLLLLLATGLQLATPVLTGMIIDHILLARRADLLSGVVLLIVVVTVAYMSANFLRAFLLVKIKVRLAMKVHQDLLRHISRRLSFTYGASKQSGYLASRVLDDPNAVYDFTTESVLTLAQNLLTFAVALGIMVWMSWQTALLSLVILPLYLAIGSRFVDRLRALSGESAERQAQRHRILNETLAGLYTVNTLGAEAPMLRRFARHQKGVIRTQVRSFLLGSKVSYARGFIAALGPVVVLWYGGLMVIRGELSIGQLVAFSAVFGYLFNAAQNLSVTQLSVQRVLVALKRIFEILDEAPAVESPAHAVAVPELIREVAFEGVSFHYEEGGTQALSGVNLRLPAGTVVALAGKSGAGKSTVAHLLMRFYDPRQGRITLDGVDLREVSLASLRRRVALVPQDVFLFSMTIEDNIRLGRPEASRSEVEEAARLANAHDFITRLPQGYATALGERGMNLSGGERQRLGIARALLGRPRLLILDEAVASVDGAAELAICETVRTLNQERGLTVVVIAHRLSTIVQSDLIYFLDAGRVIAAGDHPTLLAHCPAYEGLIRFQYGCTREGEAEEPARRGPRTTRDEAPAPRVLKVG